jgi:hypothetical protein
MTDDNGPRDAEPTPKLTPQQANETQRQADEELSKYLEKANPQPRQRQKFAHIGEHHARVRWRRR